jgi:hypothetical protein
VNDAARLSRKPSSKGKAFERVVDDIRASRRPCVKCGEPAMYQTQWKGGRAFCQAHKPVLTVKFPDGQQEDYCG